MKNNGINKYIKLIFLSIGTILIIISLILIFYDRIVYLKNEVFTDISLKKYNENLQDINKEEPILEEEVEVDTSYVDENNDSEIDQGSTENNNPKKEYIGYLEIDKINLKTGLVSKESYYNNVNRNVQIIKESNYPDVINGNLILAAHSGSSSISYFKNLYELSINDVAKVYYGDYVYQYKIVNIYNVPKTGKIEIRRSFDKTVLTLITCTKNSNTEQTVYILELFSKKLIGDDSND